MATGVNGSFIGDSENGLRQLRVDYSEEYSVADNSSVLTCDIYLINRIGTLNIPARDGNLLVMDGVSGTFVSAPFQSSGGGTVHLLYHGSRTAAHSDADGKKTVALSVTVRLGIGEDGEITAASAIDLTTIALASTAQATGLVYADGASPFSVSAVRKDDSFRHKLTLSFSGNGLTKTYTSDYFDTSASFVIPTDWLSCIPSSRTGVADWRVQTYSAAGNALGSPASGSFVLSIPGSSYPRMSAPEAEQTEDCPAALEWGVYIKGLSRVRVSIRELDTSVLYGASLRYFEFWSSAGDYYKETDVSVPSHVFPVPNAPGTVTYTVRVVDTRGRYIQDDALPVEVLSYTPPALTVESCSRSDGAGNPDDLGTYLTVRASSSVCGVGENAVRENGFSVTCNGRAAYLADGVQTIVPANLSGSSYKAVFALADLLSETQQSLTVPGTSYVVAIPGTKDRLGVGKPPETAGIDLAAEWPLTVRGNADFLGTLSQNGASVKSIATKLYCVTKNTGTGTVLTLSVPDIAAHATIFFFGDANLCAVRGATTCRAADTLASTYDNADAGRALTGITLSGTTLTFTFNCNWSFLTFVSTLPMY